MKWPISWSDVKDHIDNIEDGIPAEWLPDACIDLDAYGVNPLVTAEYTGNQGEIIDIISEGFKNGLPVYLYTSIFGRPMYVQVTNCVYGIHAVAQVLTCGMGGNVIIGVQTNYCAFLKTKNGLYVYSSVGSQ